MKTAIDNSRYGHNKSAAQVLEERIERLEYEKKNCEEAFGSLRIIAMTFTGETKDRLMIQVENMLAWSLALQSEINELKTFRDPE